jgi:hypothetical protein
MMFLATRRPQSVRSFARGRSMQIQADRLTDEQQRRLVSIVREITV